MPRHSVSVRSNGGGTTALPVGALYAAAAAGGAVREIGISNTTTTAVAIKVCRFTTAGTQGSALTEAAWDQNRIAPQCTAFDTYASGGPTVGDEICRCILGGATGSGWVWTFGDSGIVIPEGTANGLGLLVATGTGQILDWYMVWDE